MLQDIHKRALRRAAEVIGGNEKLRVYLGVSEAEFVSWAVRRDLPSDIFLHLVDIITKEPRPNVRAHRVAAQGAGRQMKTCE
jgi:DNA-binding transcriptional regulator YiaG